MSARLPDHDLTALVESAASGSINSAAAHRGTPDWDALPSSSKNLVREAALPFIFHGTKALADLGYRKPRTITTAEELDSLGFQSVVVDAYGTPYVCERHWNVGPRNEWSPAGMSHLDTSDTILYHGPATVVYDPTTAKESTK